MIILDDNRRYFLFPRIPLESLSAFLKVYFKNQDLCWVRAIILLFFESEGDNAFSVVSLSTRALNFAFLRFLSKVLAFSVGTDKNEPPEVDESLRRSGADPISR